MDSLNCAGVRIRLEGRLVLTIKKRTDGILHIRADGQLTTNEFAEFVPQFESLAGPSSPMLIELGPGFTGWSLSALWRDLKFDFTHPDQFGRMAVVGDEECEKWGIQGSGLMVRGELRVFKTGDEQRAMNLAMGRWRETNGQNK